MSMHSSRLDHTNRTQNLLLRRSEYDSMSVPRDLLQQCCNCRISFCFWLCIGAVTL